MVSNLPKLSRWRPFLKINTWWEIARYGLIGVGLILAITIAYFAFFTLIYWFSALLLSEVNRYVVVFLAVVITLLLLHPLKEWTQSLIDHFFFVETIGFKEKIDTICQLLTRIDNRVKLKQLLAEQIPAQLQVYAVSLHADPQPDIPVGLTLPLSMGLRPLGYLTISPRRSGLLFGYYELLALQQLQNQVSLVLSGIQLTEARQTAEKTDQLKISLLTNVSHELWTPLNAVINATGLVADGALGEINSSQAEFLNQAVQGSEYLMKLLNDILDITKIETGQLTLQPETVEINQIIEDALPMLQGMLQQKSIQIKTQLDPLGPATLADRMRVRQILLNLLSNAIRFTKEGEIWVRTRSDGEKIYISVADTGMGIAPEKLPLIFEDYQQISSPLETAVYRRRHQGTGLGLSIVRALVELHGGRISVESQPGRGSTFTFTLPIVSGPLQPPAANGQRQITKAPAYGHTSGKNRNTP